MFAVNSAVKLQKDRMVEPKSLKVPFSARRIRHQLSGVFFFAKMA